MSRSSANEITEALLSVRMLPGGGFARDRGGGFEVASTAWGVLAYRACGGSDEILERHRALLVREQTEDGRVCVNRQHPNSYWPTPLVILAWQNSVTSQVAQSRAIHFLLGAAGTHYPWKMDDPSAHDTSLKGWPWIEDTHSWIEPTATCAMALRATGYRQHDRVQEAIRLILNRQLPHGGWNAGNTLVFGKELHPNPESTGAALAALAGLVEPSTVARSLDYLYGEVDRLRTPISLGWALLGLAAWDRWPKSSKALVERCMANQFRYGEYDTSALCLLLLGALAGEPDRRVALLPSSRRQAPAVPSH